MQTATKEESEKEQTAGNAGAASATSSSRSSSGSRSRGRMSSTRDTGDDASPTLRPGSTSSDPNTTNSTIGNITVGTITTEGTNDEVDAESNVDSENQDKVNNSPNLTIKTTERDIVTRSTTALRAASKRRMCSSKVEEFYAREDGLNEKIAALTEVNIRTQRNNLDLHRVIRAKTFTHFRKVVS